MKVEITAIPDVVLITPRVFGDERGFFWESYNHQAFVEKICLDLTFVQDNHSRSHIPDRKKMYCGDCIIKLANHKAN